LKKVIGVLVCSILLGLGAFATNFNCAYFVPINGDTSKLLPTLKIQALRYPNFYTGSKLGYVDSTNLMALQQQSLAAVLANHSPIFIKSYGPGMLATPSFRGGNANHTAVVWNGINIQNPMSGQIDFNTIPSFLIDEVAIQFGSQAVLYGSGNIGGTVHIHTMAREQVGQKLELMLGVGSYGSKVAGLKYNLARTKWQMQQKLYLDQTENNFAYKPINALYPQVVATVNASTLPTLRAENAQRKSLGWMQEMALQIAPKHSVAARTWLQINNRNIAPTLNAINLHAYQEDKSGRGMVEYKFKPGAYEIHARYAYLVDEMHYSSDQIKETKSVASNSMAYLDQFFGKANFQMHLSMMAAQSKATLSEAPETWHQDKLAAFGTLKYSLFKKALQQQFSMRREWVNLQAIPLMPAYGLSYQLRPNLMVFGNVSRSYRLPTFNDLYWPEMGNVNLQPEYGWNQEISIKGSTRYLFKTWRGNFNGKSIFLSGTLTYFNKNIHNWIIWMPKGGNLSTPMNVYEVWSRGIELGWSINYKMPKSNLRIAGMHDYTKTTNESSTLMNDASLFKQLIYTPRIKHIWQVQLEKGDYGIQYQYNYVGVRYVSSDHSNWLMPYGYSGLNISKKWHWFGKNWQTQFYIQNLFNKSYQVMVNQPMPLANFSVYT
jgi:vitamin B12 transporter